MSNSDDYSYLYGFPWFGPLTDEQRQVLLDAGIDTGPAPEPTKRTAFDLDKQDDEDFDAFLAEVEANLNETADKELEREAEAEKRVSDLKESVEDE